MFSCCFSDRKEEDLEEFGNEKPEEYVNLRDGFHSVHQQQSADDMMKGLAKVWQL